MAEIVERARELLREVYDPELGLDVVELGLVYGVEATDDRLLVRLTMTTPACPLGEQILRDAEDRLADLGLSEVRVELVWDPPWTPERMSPEARRALGFA